MLDDPAFGRRRVTVNHDESPLAWLRRRKDANGRPMIDASEFAAGERLRADYERAQLMPRVTANWMAAVAGKRRSGENGIADLTESALAARRRVEAALASLEPEMANLAVDFCCFLKGLEQIEKRAAMAGALGQGGSAADACRARPALWIVDAGARTRRGAAAPLGRRGLPAGDRLKAV